METLANVLITILDLAEAEGRAAQRAILRLFLRLFAIGVAACLILAGLLAIAWGIYQYLVQMVGPVSSAILCGLLLLCVASVLLSYGYGWTLRRTYSAGTKASADQPPVDAHETPKGADHESALSPTPI